MKNKKILSGIALLLVLFSTFPMSAASAASEAPVQDIDIWVKVIAQAPNGETTAEVTVVAHKLFVAKNVAVCEGRYCYVPTYSSLPFPLVIAKDSQIKGTMQFKVPRNFFPTYVLIDGKKYSFTFYILNPGAIP